LAFFGVLVVAPLLQARIFGNKKVPLLGSVAIESFAAQIMTLPLIMMIFGRVSLVGLLANVIIVPLVPLAMLFGLFAGLAGMAMPVIAGWFALPARLLLNIMLWLAAWFAKWPHAQIQKMISPSSLVALYGILAIIVIGLRKRSQSVTIEAVKRLE
jgi:competence protein ComEC